MSYLMLLKEGEDYFSSFRKELKGLWIVEYTDWKISDTGEKEPYHGHDHAKFGIDVNTRKLFMVSVLSDHVVLVDHERQIENIMLNLKASPPEIAFYHNLSTTSRSGKKIEGIIFTRMSIETDSNGTPLVLSGFWYDLDGTFTEAKETSYKGTPPSVRLPTSGAILFKRP